MIRQEPCPNYALIVALTLLPSLQKRKLARGAPEFFASGEPNEDEAKETKEAKGSKAEQKGLGLGFEFTTSEGESR